MKLAFAVSPLSTQQYGVRTKIEHVMFQSLYWTNMLYSNLCTGSTCYVPIFVLDQHVMFHITCWSSTKIGTQHVGPVQRLEHNMLVQYKDWNIICWSSTKIGIYMLCSNLCTGSTCYVPIFVLDQHVMFQSVYWTNMLCSNLCTGPTCYVPIFVLDQHAMFWSSTKIGT
jgi:hypothetical protein